MSSRGSSILSGRRELRRATSSGVLPLCLCSLFLVLAFGAAARDTGFGQLSLQAAGYEIKTFTYRPPNCAKRSILFVFHGLNRKAEGARQKSVRIAREACLTVFAPLFDKDRFPNWRYHRAGVMRGGRVQPEGRWTGPILDALIDSARKAEGDPDARLYLFGHSAGGQFLSRISAYSPPQDVDRILIANSSAHVMPVLDEEPPYGFGGIFTPDRAEQQIKRYLELPISIYLAREDTGDKYLSTSEGAMRQGRNRLLRGRRVFYVAARLAREKGWSFGWKLVEASGVGHSSGGMLRAPELRQALGLQSSMPPISFAITGQRIPDRSEASSSTAGR